MEREIIHIHIPAFPIEVVRGQDPSLKGRPVVMAPLHSERAGIISVSPEARKEGIFKGMSLKRAIEICPGLRIIPPNPELTRRAFCSITQVAGRYTPLWEPSKPGHIFMDVTGTERLWGGPRDTAWKVRAEIAKAVGLKSTAGVAGNKMVSSIASRAIPREEIVDVAHGNEEGFIAPLRVDFLPAVSYLWIRMLLEELNIRRAGEIAIMEPWDLKTIFGKYGPLMHQQARGIDFTPVYPPSRRPMISDTFTLPGDKNDDHLLLGIIYRMVENCSMRLRAISMEALRAGLMLRYGDHMEVSGESRVPGGSFWDFELFPHLERLFFRLYQRRVGIRRIRVWLRDLRPPDTQISFFEPPSFKRHRMSELTRALDRIRTKYGRDTLMFGREWIACHNL